MVAESRQGPSINTHRPPFIRLLCDQPWTVESVLLQQRGGRREEDDEGQREGGGDGERWLRNSTEEHVTPEQGIYTPPTLRQGFLLLLVIFLPEVKTSQMWRRENIHKHRFHIKFMLKNRNSKKCGTDERKKKNTNTISRFELLQIHSGQESLCLMKQLCCQAGSLFGFIPRGPKQSLKRHPDSTTESYVEKPVTICSLCSRCNSPSGPPLLLMTSCLQYVFTGIRAWVQSATSPIRCQDLFRSADETSGCFFAMREC